MPTRLEMTPKTLITLLCLGTATVAGSQTTDELDMMISRLEAASGTENALPIADSAYSLATALGDTATSDYVLMNRVSCLQQLSLYDSTIIWADRVEQILRQHGNYDYIYPTIYIRILSYIEVGKYQLAMQQAKKLLAEANERGSLVAKIYAMECQGLVNSEQGRDDEAFATYTNCLNEIENSGNVEELGSLKLEVATFRIQAAQHIENKNQALAVLDQYSRIIEEFGSSDSNAADMFIEDYRLMMHVCYANIYIDTNNRDQALRHLEMAQDIYEQYPIVEMYKAYLNDARARLEMLDGNYREATLCADSAGTFYHRNNQTKSEIKALRLMMRGLYLSKQYTDIYNVAERILTLNDSLNTQSYSKAVEEYQTMLQVDKLSMEADKLQIEADKLQARQTMWIFIIITIVAVSTIVVLVMKRRRQQERQKILSEQKKLLEEEVERQTKELRLQKTEIEMKNRDITDSINYAQRIQTAILPNLNALKDCGIEGAFKLFIPCNIVSGDFYWNFIGKENIIFACADCTGHGVPGAFMSMIGTTILNDLCEHQPEPPSPAELLELLHISLLQVLNQSGESASKDGMDIAIINYNTRTRKAQIAGARRPTYVYRNGEMEECKGVKRSIGERDYTRETLPFVDHEYEFAKGDTVYLCSDGLADQFGGPTPNGKRLKSSGLTKMLNTLVELPLDQQATKIEEMYYEWRGSCEQFDDISLIGIRF